MIFIDILLCIKWKVFCFVYKQYCFIYPDFSYVSTPWSQCVHITDFYCSVVSVQLTVSELRIAE